MRTVTIRHLSEPLKRAIDSTEPVTVVHCAPLQSVRHAMLGWLIDRANTIIPGRACVWVCSQPDHARERFTEIAKSLRTFKQSKTHDELGTGACRVLFLSPKDLPRVEGLSIIGAVVENAHALDDDPQVMLATHSLPECQTKFYGQPVDESHWWGRLSKRIGENIVTVTIDDEIRSGAYAPAYAHAIRARVGEEQYNRVFLLKGVVSQTWVGTFEKFANTRLYITTDKDASTLSERQKRMIEEQEGVPLVPFDFSALQRKYLEKKARIRADKKRVRALLLKYRRGGFTTVEQAENYFTVATRARSQVMTLAHTDESTNRIFQIARRFQKHDPDAPSLGRVGNKRELKFKELDSLFSIATAGSTGVGRGDTLQRLHCSEVSQWGKGSDRIQKVQAIMAGLTPTVKGGDIILETTPNGVEWFCHTYREAKAGQNDWTPIFFPWFEDPMNVADAQTFNAEEIVTTLDDEERELIDRVQVEYGYLLTPAQIAFRRQQKRELKTLFPQEFPEDDATCFLTSGTHYFSQERVEALLKMPRKPGKINRIPAGVVTIYEEPQAGLKYVIGCDTSEGIPGCDPNGFIILRRDTGDAVLDCHGLFSTRTLAKLCADESKRYNNALLGIERQNHGHAVLDKCLDFGLKSHLHGGVLYHYSEGRAGWSTDATTRPIMLANLADVLETRKTGWTKQELEEMQTFKLQNDGKFEADPGAHDDRVMKRAIAEQMRAVPIRKGNIIVL